MHPLIKAAVAQSYLLVLRPFPEGNERLSRMMSSAVLLRCGYDFFRDISISSMIAKESYRYYKYMREIILTENGGDMTFFIEYFMELLVRSVDAQRERLQKCEIQMLEQQHELAKLPLSNVVEIEPFQNEQRTVPVADENTNEKNQKLRKLKKRYSAASPVEMMPLDGFLSVVDRLKHSQDKDTKAFPGKIRMMIKAGYHTFTVTQWAEQMSMEPRDAGRDCQFIYQKGLLDKDNSGAMPTYSFRYMQKDSQNSPLSETGEDTEEKSHLADINKSLSEGKRFWQRIESYEHSDIPYKQQAARFFRGLAADGKSTFMSRDLIIDAGLTPMQARNMCDSMVRGQMIFNHTPKIKPTVSIFRLAISQKTQRTGTGRQNRCMPYKTVSALLQRNNYIKKPP